MYFMYLGAQNSIPRQEVEVLISVFHTSF